MGARSLAREIAILTSAGYRSLVPGVAHRAPNDRDAFQQGIVKANFRAIVEARSPITVIMIP